MSEFETRFLEYLKEISQKQTIGNVELKRLNSREAQNTKILESIDRSLASGELQAEMRHFLISFKPELASSRPIELLEKEKREFFEEMDASEEASSGKN